MIGNGKINLAANLKNPKVIPFFSDKGIKGINQMH
jgi:hypothetical protein